MRNINVVASVLFGIFVLKFADAQNNSENQPCQTPNNESGHCIYFRQCDSLVALIQKTPLHDADREFLRQSQCSYDYNIRQPLVCCPQKLPPRIDASNVLPLPGVCGTGTDDRIFGGERTKLGEYPWMALIEYSKPHNRKGFHCGGVMINERYILTAAHCVAGKDVKQLKWTISSVRLGEWDTTTDVDCDDDECADPPVDVTVEDRIVHENYNPSSKTQENDIAMLRLSRNVPYTEWIKPICLPTGEQLRHLNYDGLKMHVAGWGKTENSSFSDVMLKVGVDGVQNSRCNQVYSKHNVILQSTQLCAGGKKGMDSCRGDSGGPLITMDLTNPRKPYWYCAGIVSFGPSPCGMDGWPGVYTRVSSFVEWIVKNIRP